MTLGPQVAFLFWQQNKFEVSHLNLRYSIPTYTDRAHQRNSTNTPQPLFHLKPPVLFTQDVLHSLLLPPLQALYHGLCRRNNTTLQGRPLNGEALPRGEAHQGQGLDLLQVKQVWQRAELLVQCQVCDQNAEMNYLGPKTKQWTSRESMRRCTLSLTMGAWTWLVS